ncbi:uncharacterized protein LOC134944246 [Pseudophryne corroboree]|uniref:uncharacterized protein LOC134944246 n=1 Tax=Pseudophryne corroboree TaxID=495146 RepID=UPI003082037D
MLQLTTEVLSSQYTSMSSENITTWFEYRLSTVITQIDTEILNGFSIQVGCGSSKAFVQALSVAYGRTGDSNRQDVLDYLLNSLDNGTKCTDTEATSLSFIESSFGNYFSLVSYEEIISYYSEFDAFESGVLQLMTTTQIGDLFVTANVYESIEKTTTLFVYLRNLSVENVNIFMTQFTEIAIKKNISITNEVGQFILQSYLTIIKTHVQSASREYLVQLFTYRLTILIRFFTTETLLIFAIKDCDTLVLVVLYLDQGINGMSLATKNNIAAWIIGILRSLGQNGKCSKYA